MASPCPGCANCNGREVKGGGAIPVAVMCDLTADGQLVVAQDDGPAQAITQTFTTSADMTTATAITNAPAAGEQIVATDIIISTDTQLTLTLQEETSGTPLARYYLPAYGTIQLTPRGYFRVPNTDLRLMAIASVAGNVSITTMYFSE